MSDRKGTPPQEPFFTGYSSSIPRPLVAFLAIVLAAVIGIFAGSAFALRLTTDDPGDGRFRFDLGRQTFEGVLQHHPYPVLRLPPGENGVAETVMLAGQGKRGVQNRAEPLDGAEVDAGGVLLTRGYLRLLLVGGPVGLRAGEAETPLSYTPAPPQHLGRYRLVGEICDGKCYVGAMRPGRGLAHKACANLCLHGGAPAVFVSASPLDGRTFFLLADKAGEPLDPSLYDWTALHIEAEGDVEQLDNLMVFKMDPASVRVLP
ncbi:MAG: hypothetical protein AAF638_02160 [Pseudomonadota bacterium]